MGIKRRLTKRGQTRGEISGAAIDGRRFSVEELLAFTKRCRAQLEDEDAEMLEWLVFTLIRLMELLNKSRTTMRKLRSMVFGGARSEKTSDVLKKVEREDEEQQSNPAADDDSQPPAIAGGKPKGQGRNGVDKQTGATEVHVSCDAVRPKQVCPACQMGKVYLFKPSGNEIRFSGGSPIQATIYRLERCRCQLCGEMFTAKLPPEAGEKKYDESATSTLALLKYDASMPLYRQQKLFESYGIQLADSTIWDLLQSGAYDALPAADELYRQGAQAYLVYVDDTGNRIVRLPRDGPPGRKGVFTTGVISSSGHHDIALFVTGRTHAGENLADLLGERSEDLPPVIRMADGLSRNNPKGFEATLISCLTHGRRKFVDVAHLFPSACLYVLETIRDIYRFDAVARSKQMAPEKRLRFHQRHSGLMMGRLKRWLAVQFRERLVEPNSSLGKAIRYLQKHWRGLTAFLRIPGAPLDNNVVERALRRVVILRKNALFYRTPNGAKVADTYMSLIGTCRLNQVDPFRYLTALLKNKERVRESPDRWLPWNYQAALA